MSDQSQRVTFSISTGTLVKIFLFAFLAFSLIYLRNLLLTFLTAVVVASAIEPGTQWLVRRKIPRVAAVIIIYVLIFAAIGAFIYFLLPTLISELAGFMNALPEDVTALNVKSETSNGFVSELFGWQNAVQGLSRSESLGQAIQNISTTLSTASGSILSVLTFIFGGVTSLVIIIVVSFYLAVKERGIEEFLRLIIPIRHEGYVIGLWRRTQHKIGRWLQGQIILALIVGALVFVVLSIFSVQNAFFLALIAGAFEIIPIFGPFIGAIPGVLTAALQGGIPLGLVIALMYLVIQQIESNVIYPLVVKKLLDIHPLVVIISLVVGLEVGGILGGIIAVPCAVAITEFMNDVSQNRVAAREKYSAENNNA